MTFFLRLFSEFRELQNLSQMTVEKAEECSNRATKAEEYRAFAEGKVTEQNIEIDSLNVDIKNLQEANQDLVAEKLRLEDRLEALGTDRDRLWESMQDAIRGERYAYQTMVNHAVQKNGGGIPFPDSHSLPPNEVRKPQPPGPVGRSARILPSEMAQRATTAFVHEFVEGLNADQIKRPA